MNEFKNRFNSWFNEARNLKKKSGKRAKECWFQNLTIVLLKICCFFWLEVEAECTTIMRIPMIHFQWRCGFLPIGFVPCWFHLTCFALTCCVLGCFVPNTLLCEFRQSSCSRSWSSSSLKSSCPWYGIVLISTLSLDYDHCLATRRINMSL